jgi:ectoine hydroxylase-related dioxygenase (phytanoyl-CoA dioxygenase family)
MTNRHLDAPPVAVSDWDLTKFNELGYVVLDGLLSAADAARLYRCLADERQVPVRNGGQSGNERHLLTEPQLRSVVLDRRLLETVQAVLGPDLQLLAFDSLDIPPRAGPDRQWHADFRERFDRTICVNCAIYLMDMDDKTGPLYVIPGSHRWDRGPRADEVDVPHPLETKVPVCAGSAVLFDAQLWHTGSHNATDRPRRALFAYFGHYWMKRMDAFYRAPLPREILESSDELTRQLFGLGEIGPSVHGSDYVVDNPRWW